MIRCIAIDDEPLALRQIAAYVHKTPFLELVAEFENPMHALDFLQHNAIDLLFVDINMPDLNGVDFVKSLNAPPKIIFTTAYSEYAIEGFRVDAVDYLLKPIGYTDFLKACQKVQSRFTTNVPSDVVTTLDQDEKYLFIKSEHKIVRINLADILYIEGMREYVRIHIQSQQPVMALMSMKKLEGFLPSNQFMRVHRSYIVCLNKITTIERSRIVFGDDVYIAISEQYKEAFQAYLNTNFLT